MAAGEGCGLAALTALALWPTARIWVLGNTPAPRGQGQRGHRPSRCCPGGPGRRGGRGKGEELDGGSQEPRPRFPAEQRCHLVPRRLGPAPSPSLFLKGFYPVKEKLALGKQPTQLELGDNNQFLWACEIGSLSVLFNRKYWKRLSLLY